MKPSERKWIPFYIACAIPIIALVLTVASTILERRPDGFVARVRPSEQYEITLDGAVEGEFYLNDQGKLFCVSLKAKRIFMLDAASGEVEKEIVLPKRFRTVSQVAYGNRLHYVFDNADIYVVDIQLGELLTSFHDAKKRYYTSFVEVDNRGRLIASEGGDISTIDLSTGEVLAHTYVSLLNGLIVSRDAVYYWRRGYNVQALNPETLELMWQYVDNTSGGHANIEASIDALFYNDDYQTKVFDAVTGELLLEFPLPAHSTLIAGNRLFSSGGEVGLYCHDLQGNLLWQAHYANNASIAIGDYLYALNIATDTIAKFTVADGTRVYMVDWEKGTLRTIRQTKQFDAIQDTTGQVSLVDNTTGEELWRSARPAGDKLIPWVIYDNHLIISNGKDGITSYDLTGIYP